MQWKLLLALSTLGLVSGFTALFGWWAAMGPYRYAIGFMICTFFLATKVETKHALHGLILGLLIGALEALVGQLFVDTYLANNLDQAEAYMWSFGLFFVLVGLISGVSYGTVLGLSGWVIGRARGTRRVEISAA